MSQHRSDDPERPFFATAAKGTEGVLRKELQELGIARVKATRGGVYFGSERGGDGSGTELASALRVCLHSRIAVRVLARQASFAAPDGDALYAGVRAVPWERVLDARRTLAVDAHIRDSPVTSSAFAAQRAKDAIVDRLRDLHGVRPDVDRRDPDVSVVLHWVGDHATVLLDVAGGSLHARGYRSEAGTAPLRETLAAAVVRLSEWDGRTPLHDPLCGSGTLAIEAAQWARAIAPGLGRAPLGYERWACHGTGEQRLLAELREQARAQARPASDAPPIFASDDDERVLALARRNAQRAGVEIRFARADARRLERAHERAFVVTNPPYGERLSASADFYDQLAAGLRRLHGHRVCALCGDRALPRAMRIKPVIEHALWNGPLQCRLLGWEVD
jgi:putative N6-adenine-specific DNA methylase